MKWLSTIKAFTMTAFLVAALSMEDASSSPAARPHDYPGGGNVKDKLTKNKPPAPVKVKQSAEVPLAIFADVEEGWRKKKLDKILRHFGKGKVAISIGGAGPPAGGYFSKNQSYYLFKDLFKYTITRKFEFTQYRNIHNGGRKVYAVAERHYQRRDDGRLFKDKIYVSLQRETNRWVISEIKSIR